jgi:predicted ATPase/Tfp pilus assembly protein PilF
MQVERDTLVQSAHFGHRVRDYLRAVGSSQQDLASALALHPVVLSRKLHGAANAYLTQQEVKRIITLLAEWRALSTRSEVLSLLELANIPPRSFSQEEWDSSPLSELDPGTAPVALHDSTPSSPTVSLSVATWPSPMTRLIGRHWEVQRLTQLLSRDEVRLVTLVGPGGSGKTRLALEMSSPLRQVFADGACWVALAGVRDAELVPAHLLQTLGLRSVPGMSPLHSLIQYLRDQRLLLALDNFEHLSQAASTVGELLEAVPGLRVLVTSREPLHLYGEYEFRVPPLALPDLHALSDPAELNQYAAVQLFVERAQAALPTFTYTTDVGKTLAQICIALDGLPLALELAAARVKLLSPAALLHQLHTSRLSLLTQGARNLHPRQQTLRATLQWSYELLDEQEQQLFRRLAIFVGSFSVAAAEQVCAQEWAVKDGRSAGSNQDMLERLSSLVDKSMVQRLEQEGEATLPRFRMLETLREYGLELLAARQEEAATWRAYTDYYVALAEAAEPHLQDAPQPALVLGLTQEYENVLNALHWLLATGQGEAALRLSSALERFWWMRGLLDEGLTFLEQALATPGDIAKPVCAKGLAAAGFLAIHFDDMRRAEALLSECVLLWRELEDVQALAFPLGLLGYAAWGRGEYPLARTLLEEALQLTQKNGDDRHTADAHIGLASVHVAQGDCAQAWAHVEEAIALSLHLGDDLSATTSWMTLGWVAASQQDLARARLLVEEAVARSRARNYPFNLAYGLPLLGLIVLWQGETALASNLFKECLQLQQQHFYWSYMALSAGGLGAIAWRQGDVAQTAALLEQCRARDKQRSKPSTVATYIVGLAAAVAAQGEPGRAARLLGVQEAMCEATSAVVPPPCQEMRIFTQAVLRAQLGEEAYAAALAEGRMMTLEQALG